MTRLARPARAALEADEPDERQAALAEVDRARAILEATRRRVAAGEDGAAALSTVEWRHHLALRHLDEVRARWTPPEGPRAAA